MSEGLSDIFFAAQCAWTGHFSWKAYAVNKVISLVFTCITCGVASYLARGAQVFPVSFAF